MNDPLLVVAGILSDGNGRVLVQQRAADSDQGGLWEFPGGKVESAETVRQALARELREELGIELVEAAPLMRVEHTYPARQVILDVWVVRRFSGSVSAREDQPLRWVEVDRLSRLAMPAADRPIIERLLDGG